MIAHRSPVDELAYVRARISELKAREATLRMAFLENNETGRFPGYSNDVLVQRKEQQIFDSSRLPKHIRDDPQYYRTRFTNYVRVVEKEDTPLTLVREEDPFAAFVAPKRPQIAHMREEAAEFEEAYDVIEQI
ncbi:MAG: hypothetical protein ACRBBK_12360 [Paracoccaceae bacterium]